MIANAMYHVLVVDDEEDAREITALMLEQTGYCVIRASSAEEALERLGEPRPDLVITDVFMAGQSGLDLLSRIREDLGDAAPPVIVTSGFPEVEDEALQRGAALFIPKPASPDDLLRLVSGVLRSRRPDRIAVAEAHVHAAQARRTARQAAEELVAGLLGRLQDARARAEGGAEWLACYFGFGGALLILQKDGAQRVVGASGQAGFEFGDRVDEAFPQGVHILETGSPLLLPDVASQPSFARLSRFPHAIRFLAGVPLVAPGGLRVGAICLVNRQPHAFSVHDLAVLDLVARQVSENYFGPSSNVLPAPRPPGLLPRAGFVRLLGIELQAARSEGSSMELAAIELEGASPGPSDLARRMPRKPRLAVGEIASHRLAVYGRAGTQESACRSVESAVDSLAEIPATGLVSIAPDGPAVDAEEALRFALEALEIATRTGRGEVVRFTTQRGPWTQPRA